MKKLPLEVLKDEKAPAIALLAIVIAKYGVEAFDWQPEILRKQIEDDYSIELTDLQSDKLQAAIVIFTTDMFEEHWEAFETMCHILNNQEDTFHDLSPLEAEEIITALAQYRLIEEGQDPKPFSDEVNAYAGAIFYEYGFCEAPALFPTAIVQECNKCDMTEKNAALQELFDTKTQQIKDYMAKLSNE